MKPLLALLLLLLFPVGCGQKPPESQPPSSGNIVFRDITQTAGLRITRNNGAVGKKWMPETMGGGGAFLDYDNDGWLDILIITGDDWRSTEGERKKEKGESPTTQLPNYPTPNTQHPPLALFHNNHDGTFTDVTRQAGLDARIYGMGVAVGDYDNDGFDDLFITAVSSKASPVSSRLFHNVPDGHGGRKFVDVTEASGIRDTGWATSAAWIDYDNDGKLDLFVCHYLQWSPETDLYCGTTFKAYCRPQEYPGESCRLYHNLGKRKKEKGESPTPEHLNTRIPERPTPNAQLPNYPTTQLPIFEDVTQRAGLFNRNSKALGVCVCDLNDDGFPDLIVANDMEPNSVYQNDGKGKFSEIGARTGLALDENGKARAGMGIDLAEYRSEGTWGLAIGDFSFEGLAFYEMGKTPPSTERSKQAGLFQPSYPYITFGLFFADFDNDGFPDLLATNGHISDTVERTNPGQTYAQPSLLFRNRGKGAFTEVSQAAGPGLTQSLVGRGACRGDFDNDGKPDILLIPNVGTPRLLHNETPTHHHWLTLRLVGTKSNRNAYGAKVSIEAGGRTRTSYLQSGSSYLSAHDNRLHFGLGDAAQVHRITVRWPSGLTQTWGPLPADQILILTEGHP